MQRRSFIGASGALAASLATPALQAQEWPSAPVRIVVGFPPGGGCGLQQVSALHGVQSP